MLDERCVLDTKDLIWGMTRFVQPSDRTVSIATIYCVNKSGSLPFFVNVEITDAEARTAGFMEMFSLIDERIRGALDELKKHVTDYYETRGEQSDAPRP